MASRLGGYRTAGEAAGRSASTAAGIDLAIAAATALLLWPFPLVRLTLGVPWAVHGPLVAAWVLLVYALCLAVSARVWGRSPGMYFLDLGLDGPARPFPVTACLRWALGWTVAVVPGLLGARGPADPVRGIAARWSGLRTVAAVGDSEGEADG